MPTFIVQVREVHIQMKRITATSPDEACKRVHDGQGEDIDNSLEYSHTLSPETWTVDMIEPSSS